MYSIWKSYEHHMNTNWIQNHSRIQIAYRFLQTQRQSNGIQWVPGPSGIKPPTGCPRQLTHVNHGPVGNLMGLMGLIWGWLILVWHYHGITYALHWHYHIIIISLPYHYHIYTLYIPYITMALQDGYMFRNISETLRKQYPPGKFQIPIKFQGINISHLGKRKI